MRSELCSWSRSLTNRSFCGEMPRGQVSRGMEAGAAPLPAAPASAPQPARPCPAALPPLLPPSLPSFPSAATLCLGAGVPTEQPVLSGDRGSVAALGGSGARVAPAEWGPLGAGPRGRSMHPLSSCCAGGGRGDPCPARSDASKPGLEAGARRGLQHRTSRLRSPGNEAFGELRKKGHGESSCAAGAAFAQLWV